MEDWQYQLLLQIASSIIGFVFGLLFRKKTAQFLVKSKKWLLNDIITARIISIRTYRNTSFDGFNRATFSEAIPRISGLKIHDVFSSEAIVSVPTFGLLNIRIDTRESVPEMKKEMIETTLKTILELKSPIRLGIREISILHDYSHNVEVLFDVIEKHSFGNKKELLQDYSIFETARIGRFSSGDPAVIEDKERGVLVQIKKDKLTITSSPTHELTKIVQKYILA